MNIGIIGMGVCGSALSNGLKTVLNIDTRAYDPYKYDKTHEEHYIKNILQTQMVFICVSTPAKPKIGYNYEAIENVLSDLSQLNYNGLIVIKSTIGAEYIDQINDKHKSLRIATNPEFLTERTAKQDFIQQSWIIVGGNSDDIAELTKLYKLGWPDAKILETDAKTAMMMKCATNCFFAVKVSLMNELFLIWEKLGGNWESLKEALASDPRIGNMHLNIPGPDGDMGFGGKCFPKELHSMINLSEKYNTPNNVLTGAWLTNKKIRKNKDWKKIDGALVDDE